MNRRAILLLNEHPDIVEICEELTAIDEESNQKLAFLKKSVDDLNAEHERKSKAIWIKLEDALLENGSLDKRTFNRKKDRVGFSFEGGVIWMEKDGKGKCQQEHPSLNDVLRNLFK